MRLATSVAFTALFLLHTVIVQAQVDIVQTAINNGNFTILVAALTAADLVNTLKSPGPFTVFAPDDPAFGKLPAGVVDDLVKSENKPTLSRILQYHVTNGNLTAADIEALNLPANVTMLTGGYVTVSKNETSLKVNDAVVIAADVFATNGIIHVLDSVLLPPLDIVETAIVNGVFKTLVTALGAADLVTALKGAGPFTVFAPNDAAFNNLPAGVVTDLVKAENKPTLSKILQYHVTNGNLTAAVIEALNLPANVTMLAGGYVTVSKNETSLKVNDAVVIAANVFATNGIIHVLDSVLLPPLDIVENAIVNGNFKTLVQALRAADLVGALTGPGPFTVFAPTDEAFSKLPPGTVEDLLKPENKDKLANILKYHVIDKRVTSGDINMMTLPAQVPTLSGLQPILDKNGNVVKVNGATVTLADVSNTNGIIHVIDTVLLPPTDIVDTAVSANFTTLVTAVTAADLATTLKGAGPFTVFAPTDAAFAKLPVGVVADLVKPENKPTLTRILQYHVVGSLVTTGSINRMTLPANVTTVGGGPVTVSKNGNNVLVNNAVVVTADVFNTNGMIHAIDSVLLPSLDIVWTAIINGNFKTLVTALGAAGLVETLKGTGPFTVFAPTDEAFSKLAAGTVEDLLKPENKEKLSNILKYHVIGKRVTSADINSMTLPVKEEMLGGGTVTITKVGNNIKINDATVTTADVPNTNGIIHIIDTVLLPSAPSSTTSFYVNRGFFTVFVLGILFSYRFSV